MMSRRLLAVAGGLPLWLVSFQFAALAHPGAEPPAPRQDPAAIVAQPLPPPGQIPPGTSEAAQRRWNAFHAAQTTGQGARPSIEGFRLAFAMRLREGGQSNDGDASFTFLDEQGGYIACKMEGSGRTLLLGPEGPFLIDAQGATSLRGRDGKDDRKKLYEWVAIARNFLALSQPERVRLVELRALDSSDFAWSTDDLAERASQLDWIEVRSPDFQLYSSSDETPAREAIFRARLGLERSASVEQPDGRTVETAGGALVLAVLHEERAGVAWPESLQVIHVRRHDVVDGYRLPADLSIWRASDEPPPGTMARSPYAQLWLGPDGDLDPELTPGDFLPTAKR